MLLSCSLSGQCPDRDFLWHRIIYLRDSSRVPPEEQKAELLQYLERMENCPYKNDSTHALLLQRLGWLWSTQKDFLKAVHYSRQSLDIIYKNLSRPSVNYGHVVKTYNNLRIFYDSIGDYKLKQQAIDSCIAVGLRLRKGYEYALLLLPTRTYSYLEAGDYYKCIEFSNLGEAISKTESAYGYYLPYYLIWKVNSLILLHRFQEAEQVLTNAINDFLKSKDHLFLGTFYGLMARLNEEKGNEKNTLAYMNKSLFYNKLSNTPRVTAEVLNNVGYNLYFKRFRNYGVALQYYFKALQYATPGESVNIYESIADLYVQRGSYDSAFYFFQRAFDQLRQGINEEDILRQTEQYVTANMTEYIATLLLNKADAYLAFYKQKKEIRNLHHAVASYKTVDRIFDKIRLSQNEIQSKLFWRNNIRRLYEHAIEACYLQNNLIDAFYFFEKSRAVLLNDQLNEQRWLGQQDIFKQAQLKKQILAKERQLDTLDKSLAAYGVLEREMFANKQELARLQQQIKENSPLYYQSFLDSNLITIAGFRQSVLKDHGALVEVLSGDSAVYVLAITAQKTFLQKIDKNNFDSLSLTYISYLSDPGILNKGFEAFKNASNKLYQLIFKNIPLPVGRVIISLDNRYFPFEALVTSLDPLTYFLEDHAVSYTYSARYLANNFAVNPGPRTRMFLGVAPIRFASNTHLATLVGSNQSLVRIQEYFHNATRLTGINASRNNFLSDFNKYRIIQLYTHATDSGYTGEPLIYFYDSSLVLNDLIYQTRPETSLIVLSACETGSGKLYNGEGVFSFNRQFAALGIPSSIANLWRADNESSYRITELFYKYLTRGLPLDVALQRAKKEFLKTTLSKENKLPYYWAAPILVGQTNSITGQESSWQWLLGIVFLLLIAIWIERNVLNKMKPTRGDR